jgi:hypothetical protein
LFTYAISNYSLCIAIKCLRIPNGNQKHSDCSLFWPRLSRGGKSMIISFTVTFGAKYLIDMVTSVPPYETFSLIKKNILHQSKDYKNHFERRSVLLVKETGLPEENHRNHWQALSHRNLLRAIPTYQVMNKITTARSALPMSEGDWSLFTYAISNYSTVYMSNMVGVFYEAGFAYPLWTSVFNPGFWWSSCCSPFFLVVFFCCSIMCRYVLSSCCDVQ